MLKTIVIGIAVFVLAISAGTVMAGDYHRLGTLMCADCHTMHYSVYGDGRNSDVVLARRNTSHTQTG